MRQATIDKWIDIFKHYNPGMRVRYYCKQIGVSTSSFYKKRKYFLSQPDLAAYIQLDYDEVISEGAEMDHSESLGTDQESLYDNGKALDVIVPLMVVPDGSDPDSCESMTHNTKLCTSVCSGSVLEINVGTIRLRCSTAIPEADLIKLVKVCVAI